MVTGGIDSLLDCAYMTKYETKYEKGHYQCCKTMILTKKKKKPSKVKRIITFIILIDSGVLFIKFTR